MCSTVVQLHAQVAGPAELVEQALAGDGGREGGGAVAHVRGLLVAAHAFDSAATLRQSASSTMSGVVVSAATAWPTTRQ